MKNSSSNGGSSVPMDQVVQAPAARFPDPVGANSPMTADLSNRFSRAEVTRWEKAFAAARGKLNSKPQAGFTLIELLVVIIILGILAAVVVFAVGGVGDKGNEAACRIDTRTLSTASEAYFANNTVYPTVNGPTSDLVPGDADGVATPTVNVDENALVSSGLLSEVSVRHDARVRDLDPRVGETLYGVKITIQDASTEDGSANVCGDAVGHDVGEDPEDV